MRFASHPIGDSKSKERRWNARLEALAFIAGSLSMTSLAWPQPPAEAPTPPPADGMTAPASKVLGYGPGAVISPNPTAIAPIRITLADALNIALTQNPSVEATFERIERTKQRVKEVSAAVKPQVSAVGTYTVQGPISSFTQPSSTGGAPNTIKLGNRSTKVLSFGARQLLDISGQNRISRDIARRGITGAELDLAKAQNDLLLSVYTAYYGVLRADQFIQVSREAVADAQEQLRIAEVQYRVGTSARFDVTRAAVQVQNQRQTLVTAEKNAALARANLLNTLGLDPYTALEVDAVPLPLPAPSLLPEVAMPGPVAVPLSPAAPGNPPVDIAAPPAENHASPDAAPPVEPPHTPEKEAPDSVEEVTLYPLPDNQPLPTLPTVEPNAETRVISDLPLDLREALNEAYVRRPEALSAANAVALAQRSVDLARRGKRPEVNLSANYSLTPDVAGFSSNKHNWNLIAQVSVPFFEGGATRARVNEAKADVKAAQATLDTSKQGIALDVRSALLDLQEAARRRETTESNVVLAREALRIAQVRFQAGVSTTVEVTDALVALTQAETNRVNADFDYLGGEARLRKGLGRLVPNDTAAAVQERPGPPPAVAPSGARGAHPLPLGAPPDVTIPGALPATTPPSTEPNAPVAAPASPETVPVSPAMEPVSPASQSTTPAAASEPTPAAASEPMPAAASEPTPATSPDAPASGTSQETTP